MKGFLALALGAALVTTFPHRGAAQTIDADQSVAMDKWQEDVRRRLVRRVRLAKSTIKTVPIGDYPMVLLIAIEPNGRVQAVEIEESSGYERLDQRIVHVLTRGPMQPLPSDAEQKVTHVRIPVVAHRN